MAHAREAEARGRTPSVVRGQRRWSKEEATPTRAVEQTHADRAAPAGARHELRGSVGLLWRDDSITAARAQSRVQRGRSGGNRAIGRSEGRGQRALQTETGDRTRGTTKGTARVGCKVKPEGARASMVTVGATGRALGLVAGGCIPLGLSRREPTIFDISARSVRSFSGVHVAGSARYSSRRNEQRECREDGNSGPQGPRRSLVAVL